MKYFIDYGTGAGNAWIDGNIEEAKELAEKGLCYTQVSVSICDEDNNEVAKLPWWGTKPEEDDIVTARFGDGFFGEWQDL